MNQPYQAYTRASHTVGKTRQVVMLYDGAIRMVQQAIEAIERKDYETRYHKLARVTEIIIGLQASLDLERGGDVAKLLYSFYASIEGRIYPIHHNNDVKECAEIIRQLKEMRDAWDQVDRAGGGQGVAAASEKSAGGDADPVVVSA